MHIKYTNKQMDVQKAWLYLLNRYYAYKANILQKAWLYSTVTMHIKYTNKQMDVQKAWLYSLNRYYAYKVYKQIDGCTKSLAWLYQMDVKLGVKPLLCI